MLVKRFFMKHILQPIITICCAVLMAFQADAQCSFNPSSLVTNTSCFGGNDGAIDLNVSGGPAPFSYIWANGATTEDIAGLAAGAYTVTISDAVGCTMTYASTVTQPAGFQVTAQNLVLTCTVTSGIVPVTITGGVPPYNWLMSNGASGVAASNQFNISPINSAGSYTVTVTDGNGCTSTGQFSVFENTAAPIANAGPDFTLTCMTTQTTLVGTGSSIGANFFYFWTGPGIVAGGTSLTPVVNQPGVYTLTVTNALNGCTATDQVVVTADVVIPTINVLSQIGLPCGGGFVTIPVTVSGGPNTTYFWTGPNNFNSNFQNPTTNVAGTYTLLVTNTGNGCTSSAIITVFPGPAIPAQNFSVSNNACNQSNSGAIDLTPNFGTGPHTYLWSNGSTAQDLTNLTAGVYTVSVQDATGCNYYANVHVLQSSGVLLSTTSTHITCFGGNNGSISLTAFNGIPPYSYIWTGPQGFTSTVEDPSNLFAGAYSVTVTDAAGCTRSLVITLSTPMAISIPNNGIIITSISCHGASDGAIDISPTGGKPPFTYDWSNDGPEGPDNDPEDLTGLPAGTYTVTITDLSGCTFVPASFILTEPAQVMTGSTVVTHIPCGGTGTEGALDLTISGGTSPYSYSWSNGNTAPNINSLAAGTYSVTVTDANGCTIALSGTVLPGSIIPTGDFSTTPASCEFGSQDGSISLNNLPAAAIAPLAFAWLGPNGYNANTQNINFLAAGAYSLTITDANSCLFIADFELGKVPATFLITLTKTLLGCNTTNIEAGINGGIAPYTYSWTNGATSSSITSLASATYTVTITDITGCSKTASTTVSNPPAIALTANVSGITCFGGNNGYIDITVTGGTAPYTYLWSNGLSIQDLSNLGQPGSYCVTITDTNGCTKSQCFNMTAPSPMVVTSAVTAPTCSGSNDGSLLVVVNNGNSGPYTWNMAGPVFQNGIAPNSVFTINGLSSGAYCITVTNANGCSAISCATIGAPAPIIISLMELSNTCDAAALQVNFSNGTAPFTFAWANSAPLPDVSPTIIANTSDDYHVTITDANGCTAIATITVTLANGSDCGYVRGSVIFDNNDNCSVDLLEPGLSGWLVRAEGLDTLYGVTDANGKYLVAVPAGAYQMAVLAPNNLWEVCPQVLLANVTMQNDTAFGGDFPVKAIALCPALSVSIGTQQLRRCFSTNYYNVSFCNNGTAPAENAYIDVLFDPFISFISSAMPSQSIGTNQRRFYIGNVAIGDCGNFSVRVSINCNAVLGQTHCTEAHIYPDTLCNTNALWSGASLAVRSICNSDSIRFVIKNVGTGNMSTLTNYIVVEDAVMLMQAPMPLLNAGDSIIVSFPANGSTWRVEVGQEAYHPYPQPASLSIEGCTTSISFSTGYVNQFQLGDHSESIDIDCTANIGSYDPNDKQGYPIGYGAAHYVRPGTEIEYMIRFQNTGTDTAFTVRIIDTLSTWLDPASVKFGASSHPYRYDLCGEGIVHFIFEDIMLPDSNVNEPASHGFVKFKVQPRSNAPLESVIENSAAIYFDFNDPVITNTTFHRLGENFVTVGLWHPSIPQARVTASPNPFGEETLLEVKGLLNQQPLQLQVFDFKGNEIRSMESDNTMFRLKKVDWPAGVYFFKITQEGKIVGSGKLIVQ
jgi:uncharacterized repeat protein (TIGR01451 family)